MDIPLFFITKAQKYLINKNPGQKKETPSPRRHRPRHHRHRPLVRPAGAAGLAEPPHEIDGRSAGGDDVPVGVLRGADGRVRRGAGVQRADPGAAAGVLRAVPDELGAVFAVWEVCEKAFSFFFRFGFSQLWGDFYFGRLFG